MNEAPRPRAFESERCANCYGIFGKNGHGMFDCAINSYHVRPSDIQAGVCIRCGAADIDLFDDSDELEPTDWYEPLELVKCRNCGLIANATQ